MGQRPGKILGAFFGDAQGFGRVDAGSRAGFTQLEASIAVNLGLQFSLFLHDVWPRETWAYWSRLIEV